MSAVISSSFQMGRPNSRLLELKYAVYICLWTTKISSSARSFASVDLFFIMFIGYHTEQELSRRKWRISDISGDQLQVVVSFFIMSYATIRERIMQENNGPDCRFIEYLWKVWHLCNGLLSREHVICQELSAFFSQFHWNPVLRSGISDLIF